MRDKVRCVLRLQDRTQHEKLATNNLDMIFLLWHKEFLSTTI
jgi:hypothetical protein